jgi:putative spermidine/putrescine transport system permease protein
MSRQVLDAGAGSATPALPPPLPAPASPPHRSASRLDPPARGGEFLYLLPLLVLLAFAFLWPLWGAALNSLHPNTPQGIDAAHWTLANYTRLADPLFATILLRTLRISLTVSAISALLAYPVALHLARRSPQVQVWMILAYVSPFLINTIVKSFGWSLLLRQNGLINTGLRALHLINAPLHLMLNETGIIIALVPGHFMFVLLPLWAAISGLDTALSWAAGTLGAPPRQVFLRVILPLTLPALVAGLAINFIMNMTAFAAPAILGGERATVASMLAFQINLEQLDWPLGSALAVVLLGLTLALVGLAQLLVLRRRPA